ncbi:hydroxymethylglutaryl-CoA lyase [Microvirga massiliensis]|uniref:hydroxymethylglutaryl-CoA lyase n=1 Tax=Microvirga massiliensis TaxID=1033741 RepID=UPI00062B4729|nr:hydroxymethylglutaryl-CoA lyase [Microvirga massiliensis]
MSAEVTIVEVGPRDGFQAIAPIIPTERKIEFACKLADSGLRRIEIGSAVNPKLLPQMADVFDVHTAVRNLRPHVALSILAPNRKGVELALAHGVEEIVYVLSVSESHNRSNVHRSVAQSLADFVDITALVQGIADFRVRVDLATAFHCPFEGVTSERAVLTVVERLLAARDDIEICACDTTGRASPWAVREFFARCRSAFGADRPWAFHGHDTYGLGLANVVQAFEAGVRVFDASFAGLGGCPYAPGATGNVATEDVAFLFENASVSTGLDLAGLVAVAGQAATIEGAQAGGRVKFLSPAQACRSGITATV